MTHPRQIFENRVYRHSEAKITQALYSLTVLKLVTTLAIIVRQIKLDFLSKNNIKGLQLKTHLKESLNIKFYALSDSMPTQISKGYMKV